MYDKLEELKAYYNTKFNKQEEKLTKNFNNFIDDLKKEITVQIQNEVLKRCKVIESKNKTLKKQVAKLRKLSIENQSNNKELDQYGWRLYLRIGGIPAVSNESSDEFYEVII